MKQTLPKKAQFLLADDVRNETNGKMTVVGLYADGRIFISAIPDIPGKPANAVAYMPQFALACMMFGGVGKTSVGFELKSPSDTTVGAQSLPITMVSGSVATVVFKGVGLWFPEFGDYRAIVSVGSKKFTFPFSLLPGPPPILAG